MEDTEPVEFLAMLWSMGHALERASQKMLREHGVTGRQRLTIRMLGEKSDLSAGELARLLHVDPSTMSGILTRLEREQLIERLSDPQDRRSWKFRLTSRGRGVDRLRHGTIEAAVRTMLQETPGADLASVRKVLRTFETALLAICEDGEEEASSPVPASRRKRRQPVSSDAQDTADRVRATSR